MGKGLFRRKSRGSTHGGVASRAQMVVYAWVNDRGTLRKAGAATDPYAVFAGMLAGGGPPGGWLALLAAAQTPEAVRRFGAVDGEEA